MPFGASLSRQTDGLWHSRFSISTLGRLIRM
jgi:hypothetical protein